MSAGSSKPVQVRRTPKSGGPAPRQSRGIFTRLGISSSGLMASSDGSSSRTRRRSGARAPVVGISMRGDTVTEDDANSPPLPRTSVAGAASNTSGGAPYTSPLRARGPKRESSSTGGGLDVSEDLALSKADMELLASVQQHYRIPAVARGVVKVQSALSPDADGGEEEEDIVELLPRPTTASGRSAAWSDVEVQTTLLERELVAATGAVIDTQPPDVWHADAGPTAAPTPKRR
eukprot:m.54007 g.54007  ORF g.54007 m.54007 type:complete len:233 (+) comp7500_c0_seq1:473-1171(+)